MSNALPGRSFVALAALLAAVLTGSLTTAPPAEAMTRKQRIQHAFSIANDQRGDRYQYGAAGPHRFDCSGLTYFSFRQAGFRNVPRTSTAQARHTRRIPKSQLRRGDFVFFHDGAARASNVYHVGIFAGWVKGRRVIVHAPSTGRTVHRARIWTRSWFAGTLR
ncbi:MAG: C40 family peptidase [Actinomycetes bacterium]